MGPLSRALVIESPHPSLDTYLSEIGIQSQRLEKVPDEDALIRALHETQAQVLFKRSRVPVTRRVLESCPELHAVQLCCIGDDSVDKSACADYGVMVFNDPISNGRSVVELTVAHLIGLSRRLYETNDQMHQHFWDKSADERYEVQGKTLGIVGLGNIGRQVARVCEALGMKIAFYDNRPVAREIGSEMGWRSFPSLEDLFGHSDMVTIHISAYDFQGRDNTNLLNPFLSLLANKREGESPRLFLNLARGNLYTADALLEAVLKRQIQYASVDVYPEEPAPGNKSWKNPYAAEPRIVCTPHIGAATMEAQPRIARRVSSTIADFSRYGSIRDCVFDPRFALSVADEAQGQAILAVVHSTVRGTKKAVNDAIYQAGVSNLGSTHRDFEIGVAYDISYLERPLERDDLAQIAALADQLSRVPRAVRSIRQIALPKGR